ncbi:lachesin-like [Anoplophora glabripennis]|uniref:lachesin-like n=1 Tax=Anoplophora glabripennis TaxID=217634 RepID=UPI0008745B98|nr:lachesin-like [Anoplophora glabripennis]
MLPGGFWPPEYESGVRIAPTHFSLRKKLQKSEKTTTSRSLFLGSAKNKFAESKPVPFLCPVSRTVFFCCSFGSQEWFRYVQNSTESKMRFLNRHCAPRQLHNMTATQATFLFCSLLQAIFAEGQIPKPEPQFLALLENHKVTQGRDVSFTCGVKHLGTYKVAWIKSDTKAILAIHTHLVAQNPRLSVTHNGHDTWKLHVSNVQKNDSGTYMCQINTDPMRSQMGHLEVVISPDILPDNESSEGMAVEGGTIRLKCKATGVPEPTVLWRREDGNNIILRPDGGRERQVLRSFDGEVLTLMNVQRTDMGAYLCIASNGVPPSVSKRFNVIVHFHPLIRVSNQLVAAPIASDVHVQCYVEASPKAMNHWMRNTGEKLIPSDKYIMEESVINEYSLQMNLTILSLDKRDFGGYTCTSVNALGKAEGVVRLQERIVKSTSTASTPKYIETKPRKPAHKDKSKKWKQSRKKENSDSKNEDEQEMSTLFLPELGTVSPSITSVVTTSRSPSVWLQHNNGNDATRGSTRYVIIALFVLKMCNLRYHLV